MKQLRDKRCPYCNRLLYKGEVLRLQIKCPRCKGIVYHEVLDLKAAIDEHRNRNQK